MIMEVGVRMGVGIGDGDGDGGSGTGLGKFGVFGLRCDTLMLLCLNVCLM